MKNYIKTMRSVITSLLFIITIITLSTQFVFIFIKTETNRITDLIDRNRLLEIYLDNKQIEDSAMNKILINYIEDQINYIFYSRSYPSTQNINYAELDEENEQETRLLIEKIKDKFDIEYATILDIRIINSILLNSSIFLLLNITIFVIFLLTAIIKKSFKVSFKIFNMSLLISGFITLIAGYLIYTNLNNVFQKEIYALIKSAIDKNFIKNYIELTFIYISIGALLLFINYYIDKILKKDYRLRIKF